MSVYGHRLTLGLVSRHLPRGSRAGTGIALLDIAQDFLLAHLQEQGVFEYVSFKGGTALRKLYAGGQGRFSTDLDFAALPDQSADRRALTAMIAGVCAAEVGPFRYEATARGDRYQIAVESDLGRCDQTIKLEIGPPSWLRPVVRPFVDHITHTGYDFPLPALPCMRIEEIIAEKIARLTRQSTARDAYDLGWAAQTSPHSQFDRGLTRRLATLKVWVDNHGLAPAWSPALSPRPLDLEEWFADRGDQWDDESIGLLAEPAPTLEELARGLKVYYGWLRDLSTDEAVWAKARGQDRGAVIAAIRALPNGELSSPQIALY